MLALLLLPYMASTPGSPRISVVSSEVHYWLKDLKEAGASHILNKLNDEKTANMAQRYNVSKRMFIYFLCSFAFKGTDAIAASVQRLLYQITGEEDEAFFPGYHQRRQPRFM
jgi:hypothetical protein